jgi:2-polyprenyl-3-methyl-5-hydroxy-6-metoxy-1,4-benzoquinol methylase
VVTPAAGDRVTYANAEVLEFYKTLPFNIRESVDASAAAVRTTDHATAYPVLRPLLRPGLRVLDVGCGTGWMANSLAWHHRVDATGVDFNPVAVERARAVATALQLPAHFTVGDLFTYEPETPFDLVISLGVLHHTNDCHAAVRRACTHFVRPGGHVLIGLYHGPGRRPLLDHFAAMRDHGATEQQMFDRYRQLHSQISDETLLRSWFRDQVLHPHETQHTLEEMLPTLDAAGMELIATSINRFAPIRSRSELFAEEQRYRAVAEERLRANQYFTGFFVFLARRRADGAVLDTKPYVQHHPTYGYHYVPRVSMTLPRPGGGRYQIAVNADGIRSNRDYARATPANTQRIVVLGDSMPAGQFVSNDNRFSELLERRVPGLEVINLALEGSGTDQQLLVYEELGLQFDHDLVVLLPFLQNIRRNMVDAREAIDAATGKRILRPKPRFELVDGNLVLRNVPVPRAPLNPDQMRTSEAARAEGLKTRLSKLPGAGVWRKAIQTLVPWEPFPEYRDPDSPEWLLMAALVRRLKARAGDRPVVVAPTFYANYLRFRMARNYWDRFASLAAIPGVHAIDLLPHFAAASRDDANACFQEPYDMHFSAFGHLVLADALQLELERLQLLRRSSG